MKPFALIKIEIQPIDRVSHEPNANQGVDQCLACGSEFRTDEQQGHAVSHFVSIIKVAFAPTSGLTAIGGFVCKDCAADLTLAERNIRAYLMKAGYLKQVYAVSPWISFDEGNDDFV